MSHFSSLVLLQKICLVYLSIRFVNIWLVLWGRVISPVPSDQPGGPGYPFLVWVITLDLSSKGDPVSSCATRCIALGIIWPLKPHHCIKVGIPSLRVLCLCVQVIWKSEVLQLWSFSKKRKLFFTSVCNLAICFSGLQNCCLISSESGLSVMFFCEYTLSCPTFHIYVYICTCFRSIFCRLFAVVWFLTLPVNYMCHVSQLGARCSAVG